MALSARAVATLLLFMASVACRRDVDRNDLVGTWSVAASSRQRLGASASVPMTIDLREDGSFVAMGVASDLLDFRAPELVSGRGTWRYEKADAWVQLVFEAIESPRFATRLPYGSQLYVALPGAGPKLFYFRGDPDEGDRVTFEKTRHERRE
jgi:hypothetical protein